MERRNDHEGDVIPLRGPTRYMLDVGWDRGYVVFRDGEMVEKETSPCFRKVASQGEEAVKKLSRAHGWILREELE